MFLLSHTIVVGILELCFELLDSDAEMEKMNKMSVHFESPLLEVPDYQPKIFIIVTVIKVCK